MPASIGYPQTVLYRVPVGAHRQIGQLSRYLRSILSFFLFLCFCTSNLQHDSCFIARVRRQRQSVERH